jgi:Zn-finger protein
MRSIWSCSSCVVLLLFACIGNDVAAAHAGRQRKDELHRIAKAQVTAHPAHPARRDEGACPTAHSLCPASLSGDCCPAGYACATDSCYATTAGPTSACGRVGYYPCAFSEGGELFTSCIIYSSAGLTLGNRFRGLLSSWLRVRDEEPMHPSRGRHDHKY